MGLLAWLGHSLYQPIWKKDRYHASCRACSARLRPTGQEQLANFGMPALGAGVAVGLSATFHFSETPYDLWVVMLGLVVGIFAHYPLAKYEPVDPNALPLLPGARTTESRHPPR